jgi:hypothetical protein
MGGTQKWMVYNGKSIYKWMIRGVPHGHGTPNLGNPYIHIYIYTHIPGIVSKKNNPFEAASSEEEGVITAETLIDTN